jgi:hypothetical protein
MLKYKNKKNIINQDKNIVPDNTVCIIPLVDTDLSKINTYLKSMRGCRKRSWFEKDFYYCLPLSVANQQGFSVSVPFDFEIFWNGGKNPEDLFFKTGDSEKKFNSSSDIAVTSHFGRGIVTLGMPIILKTPPNVNLMVIGAPNHIHKNIFPLTAMVETDNLRNVFSINIKIISPNIWTKIKANKPIVSLIPIKRGFSEKFDLKLANEIFNKNILENELEAFCEHKKTRNFITYDRTYFGGTDIFGNEFNNHNLPN